jgi:hypothetical protein
VPLVASVCPVLCFTMGSASGVLLLPLWTSPLGTVPAPFSSPIKTLIVSNANIRPVLPAYNSFQTANAKLVIFVKVVLF